MSRKYQSSRNPDERPEADASSLEERSDADRQDEFDDLSGGFIFGKEAKISLAVIGVLLIVLVAVVYNRLTASDDDASAAGDTAAESETGEGTFNKDGEVESPVVDFRQAAVVEAKAGPADMSGESLSLPDWVAPSYLDPGEDSPAGPGSPSLSRMPNLGVTSSADYVEVQSPGTAGGSPPSGQAGISQTADNRQWSGQPAQPLAGAYQAGTLPPVDSGGANLSGASGTVDRYGYSQEGNIYATPIDEQNPLRDQAGATPAAGDPGLVNRYSSGDYAYTGAVQTAEGSGQQQVTGRAGESHSTFRTPDTSGWAEADGMSSVPSPPGDLSQQYASDGVSNSALAQSPAITQPLDSGTYDRQSTASERIGSASSNYQPMVSQPVGQYAAGGITSNNGKYLVQLNDNYCTISQKLYGTDAYFKALVQHNRAAVPDENRLIPGIEILAPDVSELHKVYPDLCPKPNHRKAASRRTAMVSSQPWGGQGRVYVVQKGDTLFDIARFELGKATRWTEVVNLNKELLGSDLNDLNYLTPGMKLVLPEDKPAGAVTRLPHSLYQR